jgi:hypothetical protein
MKKTETTKNVHLIIDTTSVNIPVIPPCKTEFVPINFGQALNIKLNLNPYTQNRTANAYRE